MMIVILCVFCGILIGLLYYINQLRRQLQASRSHDMTADQTILNGDMRLISLLDNLPDYVLKFDSKFRLTYYNQPSQKLIDDADLNLLVQTKEGFTLSRTLTRVWFQELLHVLQNAEARTFEFATTVAGHSQYYEVNAVPDSRTSGSVVSVICVIRDVTTRKTVEEQRMKITLEQQRLSHISELSDNIAHDIRTPLSSIGTSAYILRKTSDSQSQKQQIVNIEQNIKQIAKQIDNLLLMTQLDSHKPVTNKQVNLSSLLRQLSSSFEKLASEEHITLKTDIKEIGTIYAEYTYLRQALEHILYNAISYTDSAGSIKITAYKEHQLSYIEIKDSGCGMTEEETSRVFERFYRCDPSRPRNLLTGGNGLGLAISQAIIERHGGVISVKSELGVGSTFTISLPMSPLVMKSRLGINESESIASLNHAIVN